MRLHTAITALAASSTFFSAGVANASTPRIEDDGMTTATISTDARDEGGTRPVASTQRRRTVDKMRRRHRDRILQRKAGGVSAEQQDRAAAKQQQLGRGVGSSSIEEDEAARTSVGAGAGAGTAAAASGLRTAVPAVRRSVQAGAAASAAVDGRRQQVHLSQKEEHDEMQMHLEEEPEEEADVGLFAADVHGHRDISAALLDGAADARNGRNLGGGGTGACCYYPTPGRRLSDRSLLMYYCEDVDSMTTCTNTYGGTFAGAGTTCAAISDYATCSAGASMEAPSSAPSSVPSSTPSEMPSSSPSAIPSEMPSSMPSNLPSVSPSITPTAIPSEMPSTVPSDTPSSMPSSMPSQSCPTDGTWIDCVDGKVRGTTTPCNDATACGTDCCVGTNACYRTTACIKKDGSCTGLGACGLAGDGSSYEIRISGPSCTGQEACTLMFRENMQGTGIVNIYKSCLCEKACARSYFYLKNHCSGSNPQPLSGLPSCGNDISGVPGKIGSVCSDACPPSGEDPNDWVDCLRGYLRSDPSTPCNHATACGNDCCVGADACEDATACIKKDGSCNGDYACGFVGSPFNDIGLINYALHVSGPSCTNYAACYGMFYANKGDGAIISLTDSCLCEKSCSDVDNFQYHCGAFYNPPPSPVPLPGLPRCDMSFNDVIGRTGYDGCRDPSSAPSGAPSTLPSDIPSNVPSQAPSVLPSTTPSVLPSSDPTTSRPPSELPSSIPSSTPSDSPSLAPSSDPTVSRPPSEAPSQTPSSTPSTMPSDRPSTMPSSHPSLEPSSAPSVSNAPTKRPTPAPRRPPTRSPTKLPSSSPSGIPSATVSAMPSTTASSTPSASPSSSPSTTASSAPSVSPSNTVSLMPSAAPTLPLSTPGPTPSPNPPTMTFTVFSFSVCSNDCGNIAAEMDESSEVEMSVIEAIYPDGPSMVSASFTTDAGSCAEACSSDGIRRLQDDENEDQESLRRTEIITVVVEGPAETISEGDLAENIQTNQNAIEEALIASDIDATIDFDGIADITSTFTNFPSTAPSEIRSSAFPSATPSKSPSKIIVSANPSAAPSQIPSVFPKSSKSGTSGGSSKSSKSGTSGGSMKSSKSMKSGSSF